MNRKQQAVINCLVEEKVVSGEKLEPRLSMVEDAVHCVEHPGGLLKSCR